MKSILIIPALLVSSIAFGQSYKLTKKEYKEITSDKKYIKLKKELNLSNEDETIFLEFNKCMAEKSKIPLKKYLYKKKKDSNLIDTCIKITT